MSMDAFCRWVFIGVSGVHDPMVSPIWCMFDHSKERGFVFLALNNNGFPLRRVGVLNVNLCVGVLDRWVLNQRVKIYCVSLIPDDDAKRHKVYTGSGNRRPTSSLGDRFSAPKCL